MQVTCALDPNSYEIIKNLTKEGVHFNHCDPQQDAAEAIKGTVGNEKRSLAEKHKQETKDKPLRMYRSNPVRVPNLIIQAIDNKINRKIVVRNSASKDLSLLLVSYGNDGTLTEDDKELNSSQLDMLVDHCALRSDEISKRYSEIQIIHGGRPDDEQIIPYRIFMAKSDVCES